MRNKKIEKINVKMIKNITITQNYENFQNTKKLKIYVG